MTAVNWTFVAGVAALWLVTSCAFGVVIGKVLHKLGKDYPEVKP
jgi:hypothetical protein